jgi:hypothetical protein
MNELINEEQLRAHIGAEGSSRELISEINNRIAALKADRTAINIGQHTAQALHFHQEAQKTLYAYQPGGNLQNVLSALPKKERQYFMSFVNAPHHEREEILRIVPTNMRRPLQGAWGMEVDERPDLEEYFSRRALPGEEWAGWNAEIDMKDIKVKLVQHEAMDMSEFDIWQDDVDRAAKLQIPTPRMNVRMDKSEVRSRLLSLLTGVNYDNIDIDITDSESDSNDVRMWISYDRREELEEYVRNHGVM